MQMWQKYLAEVFGTMVLVGIGTGAILATVTTGTGLQAAVPLGFGLAMLVALYSVGEISRGYFNPAATLGAFLDRRISVSDLIGYWISQFAGAILGSVFVMILTSRTGVGLTYTQPLGEIAADIGTFELFFGELVFTAVFVILILAVTKGGYVRQAFMAISLGLAAIHYVGVPLTGASVNPARSFAPLIIGDNVTGASDIWVYLIAPLVGAIVGWIVYKVVVTGDTNLRDDFDGIRDAVTE